MEKGPIETHWFSRSSRLVNMAAKVATKEVRQRISGRFQASMERLQASEVMTRVEQAKLIAETLGQLKGAVMKAGQLLSLDASDFLPPEAVEVLSKLQSQADPIPFEDLKMVLREDLGQTWRDRFQLFDESPAASASIGQVHKGVVEGVPVAVKVQYPGVAESVDSDIDALRRLAGAWLSVSGRRIDMAETFEELRSILHQETDYWTERQALERYRRLVGDDGRYVVPRSLEEASGRRVLTMEWIDGEPLVDWIKRDPSWEERERVARALLDLYCKEFFEWGFVQTDPNPGNFAITEDGRIVLLDMGAALEYSDEFRESYVGLLRVIRRGETEEIVQAGIDFGLIDPREGPDVRASFAQLLTEAAKPFDPELQPFQFNDEDFAAGARAVGTKFATSLRYSPPPRKLLFLHRKLGGLFNFLRRLDVPIDLRPYWQQMVGTELEAQQAV
ncbi:MAG: AarF/ABC1/UbiB kinase family protein [Myxococcota bacterium]